MTAKEYYNKTRMVETRHWTLNMAMHFAEEYHQEKMKEVRVNDDTNLKYRINNGLGKYEHNWGYREDKQSEIVESVFKEIKKL